MHKVSSILFSGMMFLSVAACGNGTADTGAGTKRFSAARGQLNASAGPPLIYCYWPIWLG